MNLTRGYFGIGVQCMKSEVNYGTLFRTANLFGAKYIYLIGKRFTRQSSDTMRTERHLPLFEYSSFSDFNDHRPFDCQLIGIEMTKDAIPLNEFSHPTRACYLLGAEDHGLTNEAIAQCQSIVILPGDRSLNVSVAGSIVLYDRISKNHIGEVNKMVRRTQ